MSDVVIVGGGIRAIEDSGIVRPMLSQLGTELEFLTSGVSAGFGHDVIKLSGKASLEACSQLLCRQFPDNMAGIAAIIDEIERVTEYMDVLYGIDNPFFKYLLTMPKVARLSMPVDEYFARFTQNRALIDMIGQHFFKKTPTFFALSYFSLYLDCFYPHGGTGTLSSSLADFVRGHGGTITTGTDSSGVAHAYGKLIWAADCRALYRMLDLGSMSDQRVAVPIRARRRVASSPRGLHPMWIR